MRTYLDHLFWKEIGVSMQSNQDEDDQMAWWNFIHYLKKETDLILNLPLEDMNKLENQIYNNLTSGRGANARIKNDPKAFKFISGPKLFQNQFENPDIFLLLEPNNQELLQRWREKNG